MRFKRNYWFVASALLVLAGVIMFSPRRAEAQGGPTVHVANTSAAPVIASLIDDPGRVPYFSSQTTASAGGFQLGFGFPQVPAGHRLVITRISGNYKLTAFGALWTSLTLLSGPPGGTSTTLTNFFMPTIGSDVRFDVPVEAYIDGGQVPSTIAEVETNPFFTGFATTNLIGYMLDCAAAPCSAIAH